MRTRPLALPSLPSFPSFVAALALLAAPACDDGSGGADDGASDDGASDDDGGDPSATPTYYRDVHPILQSRCAGCHRDGGIGSFSLDEDPEAAQAYAPVIALNTTERVMPPFLPGELSPALREDMRLSDDEIATLSAWSAAGAPLGDPADRQPVEPPAGFPLADPDLDFDIGVDYTPDATLTDDYRCFAVPIDVPARRMAVGYRITPGSARVVHHVIVSLVSAEDAATLADLDAETPERAGWPCFGGALPQGIDIEQVGRIGSWTPGQDGRLAYPGTATPVPPGVTAVVSMHYNTLNGVESDRTRVEVFLEPEESQDDLLPLRGVGAVSRDIEIPAGESEVVISATRSIAEWMAGAPNGLTEGWALGASAHAHLLLVRHRLTLNAGTDGERILLDIPRWNFHWQGQWLYQEPIQVRATDTLTIDCTYDNSPEHRSDVGLDPRSETVTWGEGTTDEMCMGGLALVTELPAE
jgi:mono/diheme cytochrome c family protein